MTTGRSQRSAGSAPRDGSRRQDVLFMLVDLGREEGPPGASADVDAAGSIDDFLQEHRDQLFGSSSYSEAFSGDSFERPTRELTSAETARFFHDIVSADATARAEREAPGYESRWPSVWSLVDTLLARDSGSFGGGLAH